MDPMDYTMDDGQSSQQPNTALRCQYHQPHHPSNPNTFAPQSRDGHRYDPVHNTDVWYPASSESALSRHTFAPLQNISQWDPASYVPIHHWQGFGESHLGAQGQEGPGYRAQAAGFMGIPAASPWNEMRGYEQLPFGYGTYTGPPGATGGSEESSVGRNPVPMSTASTSAAQGPSPFAQLSMLQAEFNRRANRYNNSVHRSSDQIQRRPDEMMPERTLRERAPLQPGLMEQRTAQSRRSRSYNYNRSYPTQDPPHVRRRNPGGWDSDDDDDSVPDLDPEAYHRNSDLLFSPDMDDERAMAAMRGAIAAGKKVPSKEAIAALEVVDLKTLKDADRTCIICYNVFGVENPEGLLEQPIRLPKCKHIFGSKCIKKWFEDSDSCPYCRDKLPSELSVRRSLALETLRVHRERMTAAGPGYRLRQGLPVRYPTSDDLLGGTSATNTLARQTQEEYHYIMSRNLQPDPWSYSPPNRASAAESSESRRRQARGRVGNSRAAHVLGRPTSVGSARFVTPTTSNVQNPSQRPHNISTAANTHGAGHAPPRSVTPRLTRNSGTAGSTGSNAQTPPRNRLSGGPPSSEEASPAVAVGSGVGTAERQHATAPFQHRHGSFSGFANSQVSDPFRAFLNHNEGGQLPPRRQSVSRADTNDLFGGAPSFESRSTLTSPIHQQQSDTNTNSSQAAMPGPDGNISLPSERENHFQGPMNGISPPYWTR